MPILEGKVALILGAAGRNNLCQAIAREFSKEGAKVIVAGRNEEILRELADEIDGAWTTCDITKRVEVNAMVAFAKRRYGKLDIAVNGAGKVVYKPFEEHTEEDIDSMLDISFKGPFYSLQSLVTEMDRGGSIINISTAVATILFDNQMAYVGAKAGMDHVVRAVANEYGRKGIKVNTISPGLTETPMTAYVKSVPGMMDAFVKEYPLGRIGTVDDIAYAAVYLASDRCFMTGQNLQVNGGLTLRRNPTLAEIQQFVQLATEKVA
jgi:2-hydroxycyclohexanecarboxyl-CoA dehydrogenase